MMTYTSGDLLEFDSLRALVGRFVSSPLGREQLDAASPITDREALEEILADTAEALAHERELESPRSAGPTDAVRVRFAELADCREALARVRIEGAVLDAQEVLQVLSLLESAGEIRSALDASRRRYPRLAAKAARISDFRHLVKSLAGKILPDGSMADDASVALSRLRRDIDRQRGHIQASLERFLKQHREQGVLQEEFVTIRNDRFVVPIVRGQQRHVEGVIHGASGTGQTMFLEPLETIQMNNDMVRMSEEELREIHRILLEMTGRLREHRTEIGEAVAAIGELEFLFAKARFALRFDCVIPRFSPAGNRKLLLREARHPLLQDVLAKQNKPVIPVTIELDEQTRTLLISGPNTGGKTVSLKTAGLLALMAQGGIPVPCADAELPIFESVLADIGDQQSIQESLSTFSAHIARIREMLDQVTAGSLVLVDELGRATDPEEGGALGVAVLEQFLDAGGFTLASTHLLALKIYGANTPGVLNGSMGFDDHTLEPTYLLRTGAPGRSAGLDIASRLGLPASLIDDARRRMGSGERDIATFLEQLHQRLDEVTELRAELRLREDKLVQRERSLTEQFERREQKKLAEVERASQRLVEEFEQQAQRLIGEIESETASRKAASEARRKTARQTREFQQKFEQEVLGREQPEAAAAELAPGMSVRLRGISQPARVSRLLKNELLEVEAGPLKMQVPRGDVIEVLASPEEGRKLPKNVRVELGPRWETVSRELNLIGKHAEDAHDELEKFMDQAVLQSVNRVRIVHGHGMGVLKRVVAELLSANPNVEKFYAAPQSEGGTGATIAELKE